MVFCTYCGQSFTRDEHLERHILTHTNVKPFKCFTCHMSFARRDLLQRHYTVHGRDQNQQAIPAVNGMVSKSAGRTPIACNHCAKTKTKCDKKFPCSRCASRNLTCTMRPNRRSAKSGQRAAAAVCAGPQDRSAVAENPTSVVTEQVVPPSQSSSPEKPPTPARSVGGPPDHEEWSVTKVRAQQLEGQQPQHSSPTSIILHEAPMEAASISLPTVLHSNQPDLSQIEINSLGHHTYQDTGSSPTSQFLLDWTQFQLSGACDGLLDEPISMDSGSSYLPNIAHSVPANEATMPYLPDIIGPLATPTKTPEYFRSFSDESDMSMSDRSHYQRLPVTLTSTTDTHGKADAVASSNKIWSRFCCTAPTTKATCHNTARVHLEVLRYALQNPEMWRTWTPGWNDAEIGGPDHLTVMQLHESTRDKLAAITQGVVSKAVEYQRDSSLRQAQLQVANDTPPLMGVTSGFMYVLLPSSRILECLLRAYANGVEPFYPLTSRNCLDANELIHCHNAQVASLLLLLMLANGASKISSRETRMLSEGLTEACRISLHDAIDGGITLATDPLILHAALLFVVQALWSGDKWQMDMGTARRSMYAAMLRTYVLPPVVHLGGGGAQVNGSYAPERLRNEWMRNEFRSRLVYSWVMIDQETSLLHDTTPIFSTSELTMPMPDAERLWHAQDTAEWSTAFELEHELSTGYSALGSGVRPMSLLQLFRHFLDEEMVLLGTETTPLQLRLLLHPIQSLVYQHTQTLTCMSDAAFASIYPHRALTPASTMARLGETQHLLRQWYDLAERYLETNPMCCVVQTNLVLFHLISLNAVTDFAEIEKLARREDVDTWIRHLPRKHIPRCIRDVEEAIYHCGQVLRLVNSMPRNVRPPWWAAAIYRIALVLWVQSLMLKEHVGHSANGMFSVAGPSFAIDALAADHPLIIRYLTKREGAPCVTKRDGSQMSIDDGVNVLMHCCEVIDGGTSSRFSDGVRANLEMLARS